MFHNVAAHVRRSAEYDATMVGCRQVLSAVVQYIEAEGCTPIVLLLSPDVGTYLGDVASMATEVWLLPVHPSGARGDPLVWSALRTGLEPVQASIYAIENGCSREQAAEAVGALRLKNHAKVKAFCEKEGVTLTDRTPKSFFYCKYDVIEHAWTQMNHVGMPALLATRLWYSVDEVAHHHHHYVSNGTFANCCGG
jgi:hypothetical protein